MSGMREPSTMRRAAVAGRAPLLAVLLAVAPGAAAGEGASASEAADEEGSGSEPSGEDGSGSEPAATLLDRVPKAALGLVVADHERLREHPDYDSLLETAVERGGAPGLSRLLELERLAEESIRGTASFRAPELGSATVLRGALEPEALRRAAEKKLDGELEVAERDGRPWLAFDGAVRAARLDEELWAIGHEEAVEAAAALGAGSGAADDRGADASSESAEASEDGDASGGEREASGEADADDGGGPDDNPDEDEGEEPAEGGGAASAGEEASSGERATIRDREGWTDLHGRATREDPALWGLAWSTEAVRERWSEQGRETMARARRAAFRVRGTGRLDLGGVLVTASKEDAEHVADRIRKGLERRVQSSKTLQLLGVASLAERIAIETEAARVRLTTHLEEAEVGLIAGSLPTVLGVLAP